MALPSEVRLKYVNIIDDFLDDADLTTVSVKQARNAIQSKVQYDITPHKSAINELVRERFDVVEAKRNGAEHPLPSVETEEPAAAHTNGIHKSKSSDPSNTSPTPDSSPVKREASEDELSDVIDDAPPRKKRKASIEDDATLAARLQAEEDKMARPTRGGAPRKAASSKKKKTPKKKTQARVTGSDDSDVPSEDKPKKNTGFHKPLNLSPALTALLGDSQLSRPEVTKRLWKHIKGNDLQDPADKRYIRCDDPMRSVFKQDRVHMFTMTKLANEHMFPID